MYILCLKNHRNGLKIKTNTFLGAPRAHRNAQAGFVYCEIIFMYFILNDLNLRYVHLIWFYKYRLCALYQLYIRFK